MGMKSEEILALIKDKLIVGIDEVGRGCWAGPLVAGAVILQKPIEGLADSKTIQAPNRKKLALLIREQALACRTGWVSPQEVDALGLTAATTLAINRAIQGIKIYDHIVIDGSLNFLKNNSKVLTLVKADALVPAVSAASILAKVARDEFMAEQHIVYPKYGFDRHVGYGTSVHKQAIIEHGITPLHRKSFKPIQKVLNGQ
jgi:ribonuclease HII